MVNDEHTLLPPIEQIMSAYEASSCGCHRKILSCTLVSSTVKIRKSFLEYNVVFLDQQGDKGSEAVIGKVYSKQERGLVAYGLMQHLWNQGMSTDPYYRIVRPIAYLNEWQLLLMSKAPGISLDNYIHSVKDDRFAGVLAANWLTRLHSIPPYEVQSTGRTRAAADIGRFARELEAAWPDQALRFSSIFERIVDHSAEKWTGEPVLLHGDFHPNNVFVDGLQLYGIDFDHHFTGDPAWDVTYLVCQIQISGFFKRGDFHFFDTMARHAVDHYLDNHPALDRKSFFNRFHIYRARSLFESLHYHLCILKKDNLDMVEAILGECEQSLQGRAFR